jgi:hypothetical protein
MFRNFKSIPHTFVQEVIFQIVLHVLVFIFYSIDRRNPQIENYEIVFFLNLAFFAFLFNYFLLPRLLYQRKYFYTFVVLTMMIGAAVIMEEFVLEQIYFPDTRGSRFAGIFYTLLGILPVFTILVGFKFAWDALGKQREVEQLQMVVRESELQFLKSQINPHFLFNNLNNLYAHAIEESPRTPEIILGLSSVLRYMLYDCRAEYVPLKKEIEQLENFIKISELQIEERGNVSFTADQQVGNYQIAPLLLNVFVENAFKHSTASQSDDINIVVKLSVSDEGVMNFSCINSFNEQSNTTNLASGIGLENVRKRLELIYPNAHELLIKNKQNQYEVLLMIELNQ